jgi:pimeloyl-ACP methyl ester carboxylesterase
MIRQALALMAAFILAAAAAPQAASAAPQDRYATNDGVKIHYVVDGEGPLVVLIHGFPDYWATWKPLMAELNKAGYRTAALDTRGYNLSDKPQGVAAYAMPNLIGDVAAVIAAEGRKDAIVVGHDWGAAIAWQTTLWRASWPPTRTSRGTASTPATSSRTARKRRSPPKGSHAGSRIRPPGPATSKPSSAPTSPR